MTFGLLSAGWVLVGIALLAGLLFVLQRLRIKHREVEVVSTIFWEAALEETRARVFVRRFRHWWAWTLLVLIAALTWMLLAQPQRASWDGTRHVVLLDWSIEDEDKRSGDLELAIGVLATLPAKDRELIAVGTELESLLRPSEPLSLARLRATGVNLAAPRDMTWAVETLAAQLRGTGKVAIHIVGDAPVDGDRIDALSKESKDGAEVELLQVVRESQQSQPSLATLGVSESMDGQWDKVDIWIALPEGSSIDSSELTVSLDEEPLSQTLVSSNGVLELRGLAASGGEIEVSHEGRSIGAITLPERELIRVEIDATVPASLRELIELDNACQIVDSDAEVSIGPGDTANWRLVSEDQAAFSIATENEDPESVLAAIVDQLALRQIDATGIAQETGKVIDVQVRHESSRSIATWASLFTPAFDFQESRACPIVVSRVVRWLANRPDMVEFAERGRRLPAAAPDFDRASTDVAVAEDGRSFKTTRLATGVAAAVDFPASSSSALQGALNPFYIMGLLVVALLVGEWVLFQRGRMP